MNGFAYLKALLCNEEKGWRKEAWGEERSSPKEGWR